MFRRFHPVSWLLAALLLPGLSYAQKKDSGEETFTIEETEPTPEPEPEPEPVPDEDLDTTTKSSTTKSDKELKLGEERGSWQDIVVVIRKPFLKSGRLEVIPSAAITLNDNMIQHYALVGQLNYYLTDVLAVGLEGQYYTKNFLETYELVARQDRRLPTLNEYKYGAALNFHYVPIYAKFAIFNRKIVHLEGLFTAGVGFTQTEVIPRDPKLPSWTNKFLITPNIGFSLRVFMTRWITFNLGIRDYIFLDKYESTGRTESMTVAEAMADADSKLINHIMFNVGLSFWFPTSFEYTTFR